MIKNIVNLGDAAIYCDFGNEVDKSKFKSNSYFKNIKDKKLKVLLTYLHLIIN